MHILMTLFEIADYGGIVGDVELLAKGFKEKGHTVELLLLRPNNQDPYIRKATGPKGSYPSVFPGAQVHTTSGWYGVEVVSYGTQARVDAYRRRAALADLILHEIPNPPQDEAGLWKQIYDVDVPQIICAHDAHYRNFYPYIGEIANKVVGITCTNHAGYVALEHFPGPRAFIGAAHEILDWTQLPSWTSRPKQAISAHVWKAWKHMEKVVMAVPHVKDTHMVLAGDGIEGRYMRSKDKCKPRYKGIWQAAMDAGMDYRGMLTHKELFALYQRSRVMVDMSYSAKFAALGNHFNRSVIESYNNGVIPICTIENMRENNPQTVLFVGGKTHIEIPEDSTPEYLANVIDWAVNLHPDSVSQMLLYGTQILLRHFDYRVTSQQYLDFAQGKPAGIYPKLEVGRAP